MKLSFTPKDLAALSLAVDELKSSGEQSNMRAAKQIQSLIDRAALAQQAQPDLEKIVCADCFQPGHGSCGQQAQPEMATREMIADIILHHGRFAAADAVLALFAPKETTTKCVCWKDEHYSLNQRMCPIHKNQ